MAVSVSVSALSNRLVSLVSLSPCAFLRQPNNFNSVHFRLQQSSFPHLRMIINEASRLPWNNTSCRVYPNAQIKVEENEPEDQMIWRFRKAVAKSGVLKECKRRRFFESKQECRKRKAKEAAATRSRKRRPPPRATKGEQKSSSCKKDDENDDDDDGDNWELPDCELPYQHKDKD